MALLAVTGEGFIHEHAQAITSSAICVVPRIMPAPQALMRPWRPVSLPSEPARVTGVYTGVVLESLGFFANIIHPLDFLRPYEFKVLEVRHRQRLRDDFELRPVEQRRPTTPSQRSNETQDADELEAAAGRPSGSDVEQHGQQPTSGLGRRATFRENVADLVSNAPSLHGALPDQSEPKSHAFQLSSPIHIVAVFSFLLTIGLIVAAAHWRDGTAILAIILVSFATSTIGYGAWWRSLTVRARLTATASSPGDMVIRTREGAFLLIKCTEQIASELYSGVEECEYVASGRRYRIVMILGAILIMPAVILFGNCTFNMQALVGASYMMLNIIYWSLGLVPKRYYWDLSRYEWMDLTPHDARNAHQNDRTVDGHGAENVRSFTRTLWYVIRETKVTGWVERSGAVPSTPQWKRWVQKAQEAAVSGLRNWPAVSYKEEIMKESFESLA